VRSAIRYGIKANNNMNVYYTHRIPSTCFGQSCGNFKGVHCKE